MRKIRLYTPQPIQLQTTLELHAEASKHASQVLRLKPGNEVYLFNGDGFEYQAVIVKSGKSTHVEIQQSIRKNNESPLKITLIQGISRSDKMDFSLQKSVELGVNAIQPVFCKRSILNLDQKRLTKKIRHWQAVIHSACEQSGRCVVPELKKPSRFDQILQDRPSETLDLILDPNSRQTIPPLLHGYQKFRLMIGPEGGFDQEEIVHAVSSGFTSVSLGPRILRTETAGIAAMAILQSLKGDLSY